MNMKNGGDLGMRKTVRIFTPNDETSDLILQMISRKNNKSNNTAYNNSV
jgi:hypothetical protein